MTPPVLSRFGRAGILPAPSPAAGIWTPADYPPPPYHNPEGIETPEGFLI